MGLGDIRNMRKVFLCLFVLASTPVAAEPMADQLLTDKAVKVSKHVWAIIGFPNIGFVVGKNATLVVDTGLGNRNGRTVVKVAKRLAPKNKIFLATTHFHPEHAAGIGGFPKETVLIRNRVQQDEMNRHGQELVDLFRGISAQWKGLLETVEMRSSDVTFDKELELDLGGVTARILWLGEGHTKGDQLVYVEPDFTLISGDIVQNKTAPVIFGGGTSSSWIEILTQLEKLKIDHVLPDHSAIGDGSLVEQEKRFIVNLRSRVLGLKNQGISRDDAVRSIVSEYGKKYADWDLLRLPDFVKTLYEENTP